MVAIDAAASVIDGMIKCVQVETPVAGSRSSFSENSMISNSPSQNAGMAVRINALNRLTVSMMVYCLTADSIPTGMPIRTDSATPQKVRFSVVGKRDAISLMTGTLFR